MKKKWVGILGSVCMLLIFGTYALGNSYLSTKFLRGYTTKDLYNILVQFETDVTEISDGTSPFTGTTTFNASLDINHGVGEYLDIDSSDTGSINAIDVYNSATDITNASYLLRLSYKDNADVDADFINCLHNASSGTNGTSVFSVASDGAVDINAGVITGITDLLPADGGTGVSELTNHTVVIGSGTAAVSFTAVGTNGQILVGQTGADPSYQTMDTDATMDETGTVTIAAGVVTYAKMQVTSATDKILGRETASGGVIEEITCTAAGRALLDDAAASNQRTTMGVDAAGTDNSTAVTLHSSATTGGLSLSTQEISHRAATNAQTGYMTAAYATSIEQDDIEEATPVNAIASEGLITMSGVAAADSTFVIDSQTFTWKASRTGAGEVTIGADSTIAVTNIVTAVTADLATVTAVDGGSSTVEITAATKGVAGDAIVFTEDSENMAVDGAGTLGTAVAGVDGTVGVANELAADASYLYHCVDTNTIADDNWRRISLGSAY